MIPRLHTCTVTRPGSATKTSTGRRVPSPPTTVATDVPLTLSRRRATLRDQLEGREVDARWDGFFPEGTELRRGDRVTITAGPAPFPAELEVQAVQPWGPGWDTVADLREILPAPAS